MRTLLALCFAVSAFGQYPGLSLPPDGNNQRARVEQQIGPARVSLSYSSPAVHGLDGKDRRGEIWGKLIPYGMSKLGFGPNNPAPWRAGANENTVFETSLPITIEGKPLPAGRYGLHMVPGKEQWTIIFSKNADVWGSFYYEEKDDALRVDVKPASHSYREWLTYEFVTRKPTESRVEMQWEDLAVGWNIAVPDANRQYISAVRNELRNVPGFRWQAYMPAIQFCVANKINLEEALEWADIAISRPFIGDKNFTTVSAKAQVLQALGRDSEALPLLISAAELPGAGVLQIHQLGRQLVAAGKAKEAMTFFELNYKKNGDVWPVHVGLARGYAANGDRAKALEHARKALAQAPDELNRRALEGMVKDLSAN